MPSKTQFLLAAGVPILCAAPGEVARTIEQAGAGFAGGPSDPAALAAAIDRMCAVSHDELVEMGESGRAFYAERMSEKIGGDRLLGILERAVGR